MKKLAICIPTWNRSKFIVQLLDNIIEQIYDLPSEEIEIVISNNASTDNTREVVLQYINNNPKIPFIYSENENNIEDRNFIKVVECATAEYCWIIGDDDLLIDHAIKKILNIIKINGNVDIITANVNHYDINMEKNLGIVYNHREIKELTIFDFSKNEDFIKYIKTSTSKNIFFTFLSNVIFKKDKWLLPDKVEIGMGMNGSYAVQCYMHLDTVKKGCKLLYFPEAVVKYRSYNYADHYSEHLKNRHFSYLQAKGISSIIEYVFNGELIVEEMLEVIRRDIPVFVFCGHQLKQDEIEFINSFYTKSDLDIFYEINTYIREIQNRDEDSTLILFGASNFALKIMELLNKFGIIVDFICDNNSAKWNTYFEGIKIISPTQLKQLKNPFIIITSMYIKEIFAQLKEIGLKNVKHLGI